MKGKEKDFHDLSSWNISAGILCEWENAEGILLNLFSSERREATLDL